MNILITGATGLIGKSLVKKLEENGHFVKILTRKRTNNAREFQWNPDENFIEDEAFEKIDSIIHLAGTSIAKRWTKNYKKELYNSRINTANLLKEYCKKHQVHLKSFVSASGINYYGTITSTEILTEESPIQSQDFLASLSKNWEDAAYQFTEISEKVVCIRTAMVLAKEASSFLHLKKFTKYNLASPIGTGKQWMNWIHLEDLVNLYVLAIENPQISGSYNAVSDEILTNKDFMKFLAKKMNRFFLPIAVPSFLLKMILGEMSSIVLEGTRVSNKKIKSQGFNFKYGTLDNALENLLR